MYECSPSQLVDITIQGLLSTQRIKLFCPKDMKWLEHYTLMQFKIQRLSYLKYEFVTHKKTIKCFFHCCLRLQCKLLQEHLASRIVVIGTSHRVGLLQLTESESWGCRLRYPILFLKRVLCLTEYLCDKRNILAEALQLDEQLKIIKEFGVQTNHSAGH